ncbi:MAG: prepilin-type N-terminal cleavage/methylation domain-containing protein [Pseudomonadota bacterium]
MQLISPAGRANAQSGVTLLEMLVVVTILGLVTAALPLRNFTSLDTVELKTLAIDMATQLRQTRMKAALNNRPEDLVFDLDKGVYGEGNVIPDDIAISFETSLETLRDDQAGSVRFMPDGSSNGGRIQLERRSRLMTVTIHWLTGQVSVRDGSTDG